MDEGREIHGVTGVLRTEEAPTWQRKDRRDWSEYPLGTKARDHTGCDWTRVRGGWRAGTMGDVFPTPGASALEVLLPESAADRYPETAAKVRDRADLLRGPLYTLTRGHDGRIMVSVAPDGTLTHADDATAEHFCWAIESLARDVLDLRAKLVSPSSSLDELCERATQAGARLDINVPRMLENLEAEARAASSSSVRGDAISGAIERFIAAVRRAVDGAGSREGMLAGIDDAAIGLRHAFVSRSRGASPPSDSLTEEQLARRFAKAQKALGRDASERPTGDLLLAEVLRLAKTFDLPCAEVAWDSEHQRWDIDWTLDRSRTVSVSVERDHVYWAALLDEEKRNGSSQKDPDTFAKITAALKTLAELPVARPARSEGAET